MARRRHRPDTRGAALLAVDERAIERAIWRVEWIGAASDGGPALELHRRMRRREYLPTGGPRLDAAETLELLLAFAERHGFGDGARAIADREIERFAATDGQPWKSRSPVVDRPSGIDDNNITIPLEG